MDKCDRDLWGLFLEMTEESLEGRPAGRPPHAEGQQPGGVLVLNDQDERAVAWLIDQVGYRAVEEACCRLAGRRRPYPSNISKALGVSLPESVVLTPSENALAKIEGLRTRFGWIKRGGSQ